MDVREKELNKKLLASNGIVKKEDINKKVKELKDMMKKGE